MDSTLVNLFANTFTRDEVLRTAMETKACQRERKIHPADFCSSLLACSMGDETRSIAAARRAFFDFSHYMPEESSYYDRFNDGSVLLMKKLFERAFHQATAEKRSELAEFFNNTPVLDLLCFDATQICLPASAEDRFPSNNRGHGGLKITALLSILYQQLRGVTVTDARSHDRAVLRLPRWLHGQLLLFDMGYADHRLYSTIRKRKGFFVTPLKGSTIPRIRSIRSGTSPRHLGKRLDHNVPCRGMVDIDAAFSLKKGKQETFRVICTTGHRKIDGRLVAVDIWLVTNLPPEQFSAEQVGTLYCFRWEIEQLFRTAKMVGRLDQLRSCKPAVIHTFVYATLLGMVLSMEICGLMRKAKSRAEPSLFRVTALLLRSLPRLLEAMGTERQQVEFQAFVHALWKEGVNPNPGRPYTSTIYAKQLCKAA